MNLQNVIERKIEQKSMVTGAMGTETVTIELHLNEYQLQEFYNIKFAENYNFEIDGNIVYVTYQEEL